VKDKKPRGRQNLLDNCQLYGIPAFAGMTERNVLSNSSLRRRPESSPWVSRAGPHPEDVFPIMDSLVINKICKVISRIF
ncbi:MAG: hypothetical protein ABSF48_12750, partial [Thermodesulfobacteriota bacterium]